MKILYYCQHVLGMGHFLRSLEIIKSLRGHEVVLATGGPEVGVTMPRHVRLVQLPPLMMDEEFKQLLAASPGVDIESIKQARKQMLWDAFRSFRPEVFVIELYPFGRNAFRFELKPILEGVRSGELPPCRVACSLRDILVEKRDPAAHEKRVIDALAAGFDALLVHADPNFVRLDETFSRGADIPVPVVYTGFVTPKPDPEARGRIRKQLGLKADDLLMTASIGGGKAGGALLSAVVQAIPLMGKISRVRAEVFTGPFMDEHEFGRLASLAGGNIRVSRFTDDFMSYLAASDLSVSMAGYNTSLNVLAARTRALFWPFTQNREQPRRAAMLAGLGAGGILTDADLDPARLASRMDEALSAPAPGPVMIDLDGAEHTADFLAGWGKKAEHPRGRVRLAPESIDTDIERLARAALEKASNHRAKIFFRADDIGVPSRQFERLIGLFKDAAVPLDLAVVPAWLTEARWLRLRRLTEGAEGLFCWHQHGWRHANHEPSGKKSEFGLSRSEEEARRDVTAGRRRLEHILGESFYPVFTPPWNRCSETAIKVVAEAGFADVSRFAGAREKLPAGLKDFHTDVDLHTRKEPSESIRLSGIKREMEHGLTRGRCGFMIHHRLMNDREFHFLETLLQSLSRITELHMVNYRNLDSAD